MKIKKFIIQLIIFIIAINPFVSDIHASTLNINNERFIENSIKVNDILISPKVGYDKNEYLKMVDRLSKIPSSLIYKMKKNRIKIKLVNNPITSEPEYSYLSGITPRGWEGTNRTWDDIPGVGGRTVVARIGYSERGKGHGSVNLELHETAHAIDSFVFKNVSQNKEFKNIWKQEVENLFKDNPYFENYSEEYFAEVFAMYYIGGDEYEKLKKAAPMTYKFIKNLK